MKRRLSFISVGAWIAALVVLSVGWQTLWRVVRHPAHLDAIAEEFGNVGYMVKNEGVWKNGRMRLNHAGTKLAFCRSSEKGVGVFLADVSNGQPKMIFEEKEMCFGQGPHGALKAYPWSPDDRRFVYGHQGPGAQNADFDLPNETVLSVYNADTGTEEATLDIPYGQVAELDWLTPDSFVSASGVNGQDFSLAERQTDGQWKLKQLNKPIIGPNAPDDQFSSLAAISSDTVAWLQGNCVWTMNVASGAIQKLADLPLDTRRVYTSFDYSEETRQFLISCIDTKADSLWRLPLDDPKGLRQIASIRKRTHNNTWNDAIWIAGGKGVAYIVSWGDTEGLVVQNPAGNGLVTYFPKKSIGYFTVSPDGNHFFLVGDVTNQPGAAIWDFDVESKELRCAVPASDKPWQYAKFIEPQMTSAKLSEPKPENVVIYPPAGYTPHSLGRYPIVITCISFGGAQPYLSQYAEAVANAGAYFVDLDRPWNFRTPQDFVNWETRINDITSNLLATGTLKIDRHRIFVMSNSAQSLALVNVLTNHPSLYRGAICLVPAGELAEPSSLETGSRPLKILISTQDGSGAWLPSFQEEAWKSGMMMEYKVHPGTPHEFIAKQSQRERIQAMLHFIFDE